LCQVCSVALLGERASDAFSSLQPSEFVIQYSILPELATRQLVGGNPSLDSQEEGMAITLNCKAYNEFRCFGMPDDSPKDIRQAANELRRLRCFRLR